MICRFKILTQPTLHPLTPPNRVTHQTHVSSSFLLSLIPCKSIKNLIDGQDKELKLCTPPRIERDTRIIYNIIANVAFCLHLLFHVPYVPKIQRGKLHVHKSSHNLNKCFSTSVLLSCICMTLVAFA